MKKKEQKKKKRISWSDTFYALKSLKTTPREERVLAYKKVSGLMLVFIFLALVNIIIWTGLFFMSASGKCIDLVFANAILAIGFFIAKTPFRLFIKKKEWDQKKNRFILPTCLFISLPFFVSAGYLVITNIGRHM